MITILIGSIVLCLLFAPFAHAEDLPVFDKLWNYDKPDETEKAFREILPQAEASGNLAYLLQLKTQIARTLGLQREFSQAHDLLDEVEKALTTDLSGDRAGDRAGDLSVAWIRYFLERGRLLNSSGNPEASRSFFLQAWELGRRTGNDFYTVDAAHMMAIVSPSEHQMTWNKKALEIAEASEDKRARGWLGSLYNNMGWTYNDLGEYEKALVLFEKAWEFRKDQADAGGARIAKWCVAHALRKMGRIDRALEMQRELEEEILAEGADPDGFVYEEIAECLYETGRPEEAAPYYRKAYQLLKEIHWVAQGEPERLERLKQRGG